MEPKQADVTPPTGGAPADSTPQGESAPASIPQDQWQKLMEEANLKATEKAKKELAKEFSAAFGLEEKKGEEIDPVKSLQEKFASLEESNARKDSEAAHPELRNEKYAESWKKLCDSKLKLIHSGDLTHEDLYHQLIGQLGAPKSEEKKPSSSVPSFSKGIPSSSGTKGVSEKEREFYKTKGFKTDEEWLKFTGKEV